MRNVPRFVLAAPHRSSGKTTIATGLCHGFKSRGMIVQPFKKGPDYIDPMWMTSAAGQDCRNLDFHMMGDENILRAFHTATTTADLAVIEGNMGLFDGIDLEGSDSTAGLALLLESPVILVVDSSGMHRGIAALLLGYQQFDPELNIAGVILNKVSSIRHETKLRKAIERYVGLDILGVVPKAPDEMEVTERHLGLVPVKEDPALLEKVNSIGEVVARSVDMDRILGIAKTADKLPEVAPCPTPTGENDISVGVAMDRAFTFYYPENLEALESAGAKLVPFSPLDDKTLPNVNGLYIGGGFPEMFLKELEANETIRQAIQSAIERGMPVYAECGGMVYLARSITWQGESAQMVNALKCDVMMTKKPAGLGYMTLRSTRDCSWYQPGGDVYCHEFHHSQLTGLGADTQYAWKVARGSGITGEHDGIVYKNVLASYAHLHACGAPTWAKDFTALVRDVRFKL